MNCEECRKLLDRYVLGELAQAKVDDILDHILDCKSCRQELEWAREALQDVGKQQIERSRHETSLAIEKTRRRRLLATESPTSRMMKWIVIGFCFAMVIIGVQMRSDKFRGDFPEYHEEEQALSLSERIITTLELTREESTTFFALYEQARHEIRDLKRHRELNEVRIENLTREEETPAGLDQLLEQRVALETQIEARQSQFYRELAEQLGTERASAIIILEDEIW